MSEIVLPKFISDRLDQIIGENGFRDYSVDIKPGSQIGDGFMSDITCIKIAERNSEKQLNLVCKTSPLNENRCKEFDTDFAFRREIVFYNELMPFFAKFQQEKGLSKDDQFSAHPKCYGTAFNSEKEQYAIFLEDLRPRKFKLWNKAKPSPIDNVRLVMREIGKFHGISLAFKDQRPDDFAQFKETADFLNNNFLESNTIRKMFRESFHNASKSLKNDHHVNIYRDFEENFVKYYDVYFNKKDLGTFEVACHGDLWNNNILYFRDDNDTAEDVRFLDWQESGYASPAIDLLYNIFSSTDQSLRDKEYENLLQLYYASLSKTVKLLGSNPDELFTFADLKNELKKCGTFVLLEAPMLIQIACAESSDITNLDEMSEKIAGGESEQNATIVNGLSEKSQIEFERRLTGVVEDILKLDYYRKI